MGSCRTGTRSLPVLGPAAAGPPAHFDRNATTPVTSRLRRRLRLGVADQPIAFAGQVERFRLHFRIPLRVPPLEYLMSVILHPSTVFDSKNTILSRVLRFMKDATTSAESFCRATSLTEKSLISKSCASYSGSKSSLPTSPLDSDWSFSNRDNKPWSK